MCLSVYLAADRPLELVAWNEASPSFFVTDVQAEEANTIRRHLKRSHVVSLGSHEGCGCGFVHHWRTEPAHVAQEQPEGEKRKKSEESTARLVDYLKRQAAGGSLELYSCWFADQEEEPASHSVVEANALDVMGFSLLEGEHVSIKSRSA